MTPEEFMSLNDIKRVELANRMLAEETEDHLKNVAEKLNIPYNAFSKIMRRGNFQYNQTNKRYEKLMSLEEYEQYLQTQPIANHDSGPALQFIEEHLDELKSLLYVQERSLILDPKVYSPTSEIKNKSLQLNLEIYEEFSKFIATQFPHYRQRDLLSQSLLDFMRRYENAPSE